MPDAAPPRAPKRSWLGSLLIGGLLAALGFAFTTQVRADEQSRYSGLRGVELVELLKSTDAANDRLAQQIDELTFKRDQLEQSSRQSAASAREARRRAAQLAILSGSAGATGPGISIRITDPERRMSAAVLLDAVAELRDAGAEAIVVNKRARVVAQTYFLDNEGSINVGGHAVKPPFVIEAIGDPPTMAEAMRFRGGLVDRVSGRGGRATVRERDHITITALADVKGAEYAQPTR
jgi:uncharacterized protein YlxW (UPF0749 family)